MSGLEIVALLLGTTGPIEQSIHIVQSFYQHCQNFKQNATTVQNLIQMLKQTREHLKKLQTRINNCQSHLSQHGMQVFNTNMSQVQLDLGNAHRFLQTMKTTAEKKGLKHFFTATNIARKCEELQQLIQKTNESLVHFNSPITGIEATMSITDAQTTGIKRHFISSNDAQTNKIGKLISSTTDAQTMEIKGLLENNYPPKTPHTEPTSTVDTFKPQFQSQHYNRAAKPNFQMENHSLPITIEAQVKQHLFMNMQGGRAIISIQGEAGVGKTTTLHMLTFQPEIRTHFGDGIYYMSLGADASTDTAIQQLRQIVRSSGGVRLSADTVKWSNISSAIETTAQWLKGKTFLFLIDDVWDTPGISNILENILSQVVLASPYSAAVFTTRDQDVATVDTAEKVLHLLRKVPESRESRDMLLRYARYPEDKSFDKKDEEAISYIPKQTAGLPVAHSVVGKAVARYKLKQNDGISPWVWYMQTHKSIIKSPSGKYSSLQVIFSSSLQTLQAKNTNSSSPDLTNFHTEDYMRMHRSLCVFEKQQWILIPVLVRLWALDQSVVRSVCEEFVKVGLVECCDKELEDGVIVQGIMIHDLLHDFATEEATNHETVQNWHHQLVKRYTEDLEVSQPGKCYSWWKLKDADHGYVMKNLFRHFLGSECKEIKMKYIVSRPEWIQSQLVLNGITQYETDVSLATKQEKEKDAPGDSEMNDETLTQILEATKLSCSYILNNPDEVWFQLYGRLMSLEESCNVKEYLQEIEENVPRPWLKPLSRCLTSPDEGMHQLIYINKYIWCTAVVPGKHELVCGCDDGWIVVVDIEKSEMKRKWKGHDEWVSAICVSPRGRFIVSASKDKTVKLWDCITGRPLRETTSDYTYEVRSVAVSRDESTVYTLSDDGNLRSWVIATGVKGTVLRPTGARGSPASGRFQVLADGNLIVGYDSSWASAGYVTMVIKILIPSVGEDTEHTGLNRTWHKLQLPPAVKYKSEEGHVIDFETVFECAFEFTVLEEQKYLVASSEDGTKLVTEQNNGNLIIWNGTSMMRIGFIEGASQRHGARAAVSNGGGVAILDGSSVTMYKASTIDPDGIYVNVGTCNFELYWCNKLFQFLGDGSKVVVRTGSGLIRALSAGNLEIKNERRMENMSMVGAVTRTPDGQHFATGHTDGKICLWDTSTGEQSGICLSTPLRCAGRMKIEVSEKGEWMVAMYGQSLVCVWNLRSRKLKKSFQISLGVLCGFFEFRLDVSSDGNWVVLQLTDSTRISLWDISKTNQPSIASPPSLVIRRLEGHLHPSIRKTIPWSEVLPWSDVWFRNGTNCIVSVDDKWIEEWVMSNGKYVKSRELPTSYRRMSREDVFKVLNNSETQVIQAVEEPNRMLIGENEIRYGRETSSNQILATLESRITQHSYCSISNTLCVSLETGPRFFRFYPAM